MKNTFNVTHKNSSRAIAVFFAVIILAWLIAGCGDDNNPTGGNGNNNEVLLYSLDSIGIVTPPFTKDTNFLVSNAPSIKITFTAETNADSINGWSLFNVTAIDTTTNTIVFDSTYNRTLNMNNAYELQMHNIANALNINLRIQCLRNPPHVFFMRLKNIKVFRIN